MKLLIAFTITIIIYFTLQGAWKLGEWIAKNPEHKLTKNIDKYGVYLFHLILITLATLLIYEAISI